MRVFTPLFVSILGVTPIAAIAGSVDVDSDGKADPAAITIQNDDGLRWRATKSSTDHGTTESLPDFGEVGNHVAVGDWEGSGATQFGFVRTNSDNQIVWVVNTSQGNRNFSLGGKLDTVVSGADFDGSGFKDALIVNNIDKNKRLKVELRRDPLGTDPDSSDPITHSFGRSYYHFLFADSDGDGADEFCFFEARLKNKTYTGSFRLKCHDPVSGNLSSQSNFGKLIGSAQPFSPGAGQPDLLLFSKSGASQQNVTLRTISGSLFSKFPLRKGTIVIGNFVGAANSSEEIGVEDDDTLYIYSTSGELLNTLASPGSIPIDIININDFTSKGRQRLTTKNSKGKTKGSVGKVSGGGDDSGSGGSGGGGSGSGCDVIRDPTDGADGFLWKPESDSTGLLAVLLPSGQTPSSLTVEFNDQVVQELSFSGLTNPNRPTYRSPTKEGGEFPDGSDVVATYGSSRHCWNIENTSERTD